VILLPPRKAVAVADALAATDARRLFIADCYAEACETWMPVPWGWRTERGGQSIVNIDHHAEDPRFYCHISSGCMAIDYVREHGPLADCEPVLINHTDCDSIVTAAILRGLVPPAPEFAHAVLAADHTGSADPIADLLQPLEPLRDFELGLRNLLRLLAGERIDPVADELRQKRLAERRVVNEMVAQGQFKRMGRVAAAALAPGEKLPGEFLPAALPEAWLIVLGIPMDNGLWETKIRLGLAAPAGGTLFSLGVPAFEPKFGGRWNAGSTKRSGGSAQDPVELAGRIAGALGV